MDVMASHTSTHSFAHVTHCWSCWFFQRWQIQPMDPNALPAAINGMASLLQLVASSWYFMKKNMDPNALPAAINGMASLLQLVASSCMISSEKNDGSQCPACGHQQNGQSFASFAIGCIQLRDLFRKKIMWIWDSGGKMQMLACVEM